MEWQPITKPHRLLKKVADPSQPMAQVSVYEAQAADGTCFTIEATLYRSQLTQSETLALFCAIHAPGKRVRYEALGKHEMAELATERGRTSLESGIYTAKHWVGAVGKKPLIAFDHFDKLASSFANRSMKQQPRTSAEPRPARFPSFPALADLRAIRAEAAKQLATDQPRRGVRR